MNAQALRHVVNYHFAENRTLWDTVMLLSYEQFVQPVNYSHGSVRNQIMHLIEVDDVWFSELSGGEPLEPPTPTETDNRNSIRAYWDAVEKRMLTYLAALQDNLVFSTPIVDPEEDKDLIVWQVLLHVVNHGTDHRAQILRQLHDLGLKTTSQDYIFYVYDHPMQQQT